MMFSISFVLAPALGGWLYSLGPEVLFNVCGVLAAIAAPLVLLPVGGSDRPVTPDVEEAFAPVATKGP